MADTTNNSVWNNLAASTQPSYKDNWKAEFENIPLIRHFINDGGKLIYSNNKAYHSISVQKAKQWAADKAREWVQTQLDELRNGKTKEEQKTRIDAWQTAHGSLNQQLINRGKKVHENYGSIQAESSGDVQIQALDKYGNLVDGALIMWYEIDNTIQEQREIYKSKISLNKTEGKGWKKDVYKTEASENIETQSFNTNKIFVIDLAPQIRVQSTKNVILTKVQGRDYTRKELVSGGDLCFSVSGEIMSNYADIYPERDVQKFINIMQHNGIVSVNNLTFGQFKVNNVIIQNFQLETPKYQNIQPYSFTCVAVEPSESVQIVGDTLEAINFQIQSSSTWKEQKWYDLILNDVLNAAEGIANSVVSATLDGLTYNI